MHLSKQIAYIHKWSNKWVRHN